MECNDAIEGNLTKWHEVNSNETECLGYIACIITSKLVQMGKAKRNRYDVKAYKKVQRVCVSFV